MDRAQHGVNVLIEHRNQLADSLCNAEVERRVLQAEIDALTKQLAALTTERDAALAEAAKRKVKPARR